MKKQPTNTVKLTDKQKIALLILRQYPDDIVMSDGWLTGGHGVKINLSTVKSLKDKGLINQWGEKRDRISELGKTIYLT